MITTLVYIFAFVLVLSLVVIVHEGGHFAVARMCGVHVVEFSLGFGKELFGWNDKRGTRWKVCAVPLGGYVKMLGDEDAASAKSSSSGVSEDMKPFTFMAQKLWKRALIIFAGPATNYIFAILILTGVLWMRGEIFIAPVIGEIQIDSAADKAGLKVGDRIVEINGQYIGEYKDILRSIRLTEYGKPLSVRFERNGQQQETQALINYSDEADVPVLGIKSSLDAFETRDNLSLYEAFISSCQKVLSMTRDTLVYLGQVVTAKRSAKDMRGPLGIAEASGDAFLGGWLSLIVFVAQISVAIGFMNLLPIPLLDGGHLAFYAVEAVRRKPLPDKVQTVFLWAGMTFLFALLAYTFVLDVPRIIQRVIG